MALCGLGTLGFPSRVEAQGLGLPQFPEVPYDYVDYAVTSLPAHFTTGGLAPNARNNTPANNPITNAGANLGRVLFYDRRLSHNHSTSCASCHVQANGFDDPDQFSTGANGQTPRHSMPLANNAFYANKRYFWDERAATLEDQVLMPIQDPIEMGMDLPTLTTKLASTSYYPELFQEAFGTPEVTSERVSLALAQFVRSMVSYNSKFDQAFNGGTTPDFRNFTDIENRGRIHFNQADCGNCHQTVAQVADRPRNIGLDADTPDPGAGRGEFKVPSLRNAEVRNHFMHDGRFSTLEETIEFYNTGIQAHPELDRELMDFDGNPRRFNFTEEDVAEMTAFLRTLTDWDFLTNPMFADPFVLSCDFSGDGFCDVADLDQLLASGPIAGGLAITDVLAPFDLNADGLLDNLDVEQWLSAAAESNGFIEPYRHGDANLNGVVDADDLLQWTQFQFQTTTAWSAGDFNGDGAVDGRDFTAWNANKFHSLAQLPSFVTPSAVPEPTLPLTCLLWVLFWRRRR
jgi:cytochrome c peroxidase